MGDQLPEIKKLYKQLNTINRPVLADIQLDFIDQVASLFSVGTYYYSIFNYGTLQFEYVDPNIKKVLGILPHELTFDKFFEILHPDHLEVYTRKQKVVGDFLFQKIAPTDLTKYKVVYLYKLKNSDGSYRTILHQAKALTISEDNKIQHALTVQTDITYLRPKLDHNFSIISNTLLSYYSIETNTGYKLVESNLSTVLTKREKEVLKKMVQGISFSKIAELLFVSPHTIYTHKKNILRKSNCTNTSQLIARCIREGIV